MNDPQAATTLIEARDVHKNYTIGGRAVDVLRGVTLAIQRNDFVALRGASGAGKSTLLHLLGGLDLPNAGGVFFNGEDIQAYSNVALARWRNRRVGFIFQAYHLLPELNALENVCMPARMGRVAAGHTERRAAELLARVGLRDRLEHRPYELSGGEQQRVAIARALINGPDLILADEPTGNLDSRTGDEIVGLLTEIRAEHKTTLVIATHDSKLAGRAPKVVQLVDGKIQSAT